MAVFPDRIVLKNSTDSQAAIEAAIQSGGTDEITQGEIVLGLGTGQASIYTRDAAGAIVEISGAPLSIDEIGDVDTSTVPPAEGEALLWDAIAQKWEPGLPVAALPVAQDGEALIWQGGEWVAGPVIGGVDYTPAGTDPNIADVSLLLLFNGADGSTTFVDSSPNALAITPSGNAQISTTEFKFGGSSGYFDGTGDKIVVASDPGLAWSASDDFTIEFWIYPADGADTIENGGILISDSATGFDAGVCQIVYDHPQARNSVSIWNRSESTLRRAEAQIPTKDTWYHIAFVRSGTTITPYVNGVAGTSGTSNGPWDFSDGGTAIGEYYGYVSSGSSSGAFTGYLDDLRVTKGVARYTSNFTPPTVQLGTSTGDIVIPYSIDKLDDVDTSTVAPTDGQALVWDNAAQQWEPGSVAASDSGGAGRGDGGDFDTGTVDSAYVFGVYGGGDFDAGSASTTAVAPFAHAYIDSNNISSTTAHTGMSSAAHVYVASTDSYIDFTFDTAQPNTGYSVLHSGEAGWNVLEVENKTTSGFRVSFYDEATGNVLSTGAVGIGAPVITVYDSDPTITVGSSSGVDLPAELLGDDEGPDGGSF